MSARNTRDLFMQGDDSPAKNTQAGNKTHIIKSAFASLPKTEHRTAACSPTSSILVLFLPAFAHMHVSICVCGEFSLRRRPECVWDYSRCSGRGLSAILIGFVPLFHTQFSCVCDNTQKGAPSHFAAQCAGFQYARTLSPPRFACILVRELLREISNLDGVCTGGRGRKTKMTATLIGQHTNTLTISLPQITWVHRTVSTSAEFCYLILIL